MFTLWLDNWADINWSRSQSYLLIDHVFFFITYSLNKECSVLLWGFRPFTLEKKQGEWLKLGIKEKEKTWPSIGNQSKTLGFVEVFNYNSKNRLPSKINLSKNPMAWIRDKRSCLFSIPSTPQLQLPVPWWFLGTCSVSCCTTVNLMPSLFFS